MGTPNSRIRDGYPAQRLAFVCLLLAAVCCGCAQPIPTPGPVTIRFAYARESAAQETYYKSRV